MTNVRTAVGAGASGGASMLFYWMLRALIPPDQLGYLTGEEVATAREAIAATGAFLLAGFFGYLWALLRSRLPSVPTEGASALLALVALLPLVGCAAVGGPGAGDGAPIPGAGIPVSSGGAPASAPDAIAARAAQLARALAFVRCDEDKRSISLVTIDDAQYARVGCEGVDLGALPVVPCADGTPARGVKFVADGTIEPICRPE